MPIFKRFHPDYNGVSMARMLAPQSLPPGATLLDLATPQQREPHLFEGEISAPSRPFDRFQQAQAEVLSPAMGGAGLGAAGAEFALNANEAINDPSAGNLATAGASTLPLLAMAVGPKINAKHGAFSAPSWTLNEIRRTGPEGAFAIRDPDGKSAGMMHITQDGAQLHVDAVSTPKGANALGPRAVRSLLEQLAEIYPDANYVGGLRVSGARERAGLMDNLENNLAKLYTEIELPRRKAAPQPSTPKEAPATAPQVPVDRRLGGQAFSTPDDFIKHADTAFPRAGTRVDGRLVRDEVPNTESISASFNDYHELPGIREVPRDAFHAEYTPARSKRVTELREAIRESGELNPLIVAIDNDGPYILEGAHRFDALMGDNAQSFPAKVVLDLDPVAPQQHDAHAWTRRLENMRKQNGK